MQTEQTQNNISPEGEFFMSEEQRLEILENMKNQQKQRETELGVTSQLLTEYQKQVSPKIEEAMAINLRKLKQIHADAKLKLNLPNFELPPEHVLLMDGALNWALANVMDKHTITTWEAYAHLYEVIYAMFQQIAAHQKFPVDDVQKLLNRTN